MVGSPPPGTERFADHAPGWNNQADHLGDQGTHALEFPKSNANGSCDPWFVRAARIGYGSSKASKDLPQRVVDTGPTLLSAEETTTPESIESAFSIPAPKREEEEVYDADAVFAKLNAPKPAEEVFQDDATFLETSDSTDRSASGSASGSDDVNEIEIESDDSEQPTPQASQ